MASNKELLRDIQSDLHDKADEISEKIARGDLIDFELEPPPLNDTSTCTCTRYSERKLSGEILFWYKADPVCKYIHLQPLPKPHKIKL